MDTNPTNISETMTFPSPVSPWVAFLTKKVPADRFLKDVEDGVVTFHDEKGKIKKKKTYVITIPDETTRKDFLDSLMAKPDRISRLVLLLQASRKSGDTILHIVNELAEDALKLLGIISSNEQRDLDAPIFRHAITSWLTGVRKKPLKPTELNILILSLHFGRYRKFLDDETVYRLVASAVSSNKKPKAKDIARLNPTPIDVLLDTPPSILVLSSLIAHHEASNSLIEEVHDQMQSKEIELARLKDECIHLNERIANLTSVVENLKEQKEQAEIKIVELEKENIDIQDGYQHKLNEVRGHVRGMLQGPLTRWLQTAIDASQSDPPWTKAIQERLEDALKLIEKEVQWLQPSA